MVYTLEEMPSLTPGLFTELSYDMIKSKGFLKNPYKTPFLLPSEEDLLDQESFAKVAICYDEGGIYLSILIEKPFEQVSYPNVSQGDGVEIFIDTRGLKNVGSIHKFCHHFVFLPKEEHGIQGVEITKLRLEDSHPICDPSSLHVETIFHKDSFEMKIFIEADALYGYDLSRTSKIGFAYKIHGKGYRTQHLGFSSEFVVLEKYPSLWSILNLK